MAGTGREVWVSFRTGVGECKREREAKAGCGGASSVTIAMRRREHRQGVGKGAVGCTEPKRSHSPRKREQEQQSGEPGGSFPQGSRREWGRGLVLTSIIFSFFFCSAFLLPPA